MHGNDEKFIKYLNLKPEQNQHLGHPSADDRIILKLFLNTRKIRVRFTRFSAEANGGVL